MPSDTELVGLARRKVRGGFEQLVQKHISALMGFFRFLAVPDSLIDDLVQETFLKAFLNLEKYDVHRSFATWLCVIGRNTYFDLARKQKASALPKVEKAADHSSPVESSVLKNVFAQQLLATLDAEARLLIELRIFLGLSFSEISWLFEETENTLRVRFHRILKECRNVCEEMENGEVAS